MPNLLAIFNHTVTDNQETDARQSLQAGEIIQPPDSLRRLWAEVPPEAESLSEYLVPLKTWLESRSCPGDYVLIQGEFGATYLLVRYAMSCGLIPVYSTTRREAEEKLLKDGTVQVHHRFRHIRYRLYGK